MSRLIPKFLVVAVVLVLLFITFAAFHDSLPSGVAFTTPDTTIPSDDSLSGAVGQQPGHAKPPPFTPSDNPGPGPNAAQKAKDAEEKRKKDEEAKKLKEADAKKAKEEEEKAKRIAARLRQDTPRIPMRPFNAAAAPETPAEGPKPNQILLLAASDGQGHNNGIPNILESTRTNRQEYADLHGYTYLFVNITKFDLNGAHPVWGKLPAIVEAFETHPEVEWVWMLDLDAIIMSPAVDLNSHLLRPDVLMKKLLIDSPIKRGGGRDSGFKTFNNPTPENIDLIVSQDLNGLNAGSFLVRRSQFTRMLLDMWADPLFTNADWIAMEQDSLAHLIFSHPMIREHVGFVEQHNINSYPYPGIKNGGFGDGGLVVHFAGCWVNNRCAEQWKDYWGKRMTVAQAKEKGLVKTD